MRKAPVIKPEETQRRHPHKKKVGCEVPVVGSDRPGIVHGDDQEREETKQAVRNTNETQRRISELMDAWNLIFGNVEDEGTIWCEHFPSVVFSAPGNRLTAAFEDFRERGYFAAQNCGSCSNCGFAAIRNDRAVFYHNESFFRMLDEGEVHLNWRGDGEEIVAVLRRHGLTVKWDGDPHAEILVKDLFEPESGRFPAQDSLTGGPIQ